MKLESLERRGVIAATSGDMLSVYWLPKPGFLDARDDWLLTELRHFAFSLTDLTTCKVSRPVAHAILLYHET